MFYAAFFHVRFTTMQNLLLLTNTCFEHLIFDSKKLDFIFPADMIGWLDFFVYHFKL